jgi:hypothetical protein
VILSAQPADQRLILIDETTRVTCAAMITGDHQAWIQRVAEPKRELDRKGSRDIGHIIHAIECAINLPWIGMDSCSEPILSHLAIIQLLTVMVRIRSSQ